jgi:hypothetical protein
LGQEYGTVCGKNRDMPPLTAGPALSLGLSPQFLKDLAAPDRKRQELFMLGKGLFERMTVIYDDVVRTKAGLCKMPSVFTAEDHDLVTAPMEFNVGFVHQFLFRHLGSP